jgi:hypothetical protein
MERAMKRRCEENTNYRIGGKINGLMVTTKGKIIASESTSTSLGVGQASLVGPNAMEQAR